MTASNVLATKASPITNIRFGRMATSLIAGKLAWSMTEGRSVRGAIVHDENLVVGRIIRACSNASTNGSIAVEPSVSRTIVIKHGGTKRPSIKVISTAKDFTKRRRNVGILVFTALKTQITMKFYIIQTVEA